MTMTPTSSVGETSSTLTNHGPNGELMNTRGTIVYGAPGAQYVDGSPKRYISQFYDFLGGGQVYSTTVVDGLRSRKGTTNTVDWTVTPAVGGTVVGTIGDTTASMAVSGIQLDTGLSWKANQGDLWMEARVKTSIITNISLFIGFTDQTGALEMPASLSVTTFTTNATDAVGFLFDTDATTDTIRLVGVANDVDATHQDTSLAPTANTFSTYRVELSTAGVATFYIDGTQVGSSAGLTGAVTATVALTPVIAAFNRTTTGTPTVTCDWLYVSALRA